MKWPRKRSATRFHVLGMDIDRDVVLSQIAPGETSGSVCLQAMATVSLPIGHRESIAGQSGSTNWNKFTSDLQRTVREEGWSGYHVALSVPSEHLILRKLQVPAMSLRLVRKAVVVELQNNFPLPFENIVFDYVVLKADSTSVPTQTSNVIVLAASRLAVDPFVTSARQAGLRPVVVIPGVLGAQRLVNLQVKTVGYYAVLVLGYQGMELGVFCEENLIYIRYFDIKLSDSHDAVQRENFSASVGYEMQRALSFIQYTLLREEEQLHTIYVISRISDLEPSVVAFGREIDTPILYFDSPFTIHSGILDRSSLANVSVGLAMLGEEK